jgi:membrane fusion protein
MSSRVAILEARAVTARADLDALDASRAASYRDLKARVASQTEQYRRMSDQIDIQAKRTASSQQLYDQWVRLGATGVVSKAQTLQQRDVVLQGQSNESQLRLQQSKLAEDLAAARSSLDDFDGDFAGKRRKLERDLGETSADLATARLELGSVVRSPIDGTVTAVLSHAGQRATRQDVVLSIVPDDHTMLAELWMSSSAIGFVRSGQRVMLRYRAYPYQAYGEQGGQVSEVSEVALDPGQLRGSVADRASGPMYRVLVKLDSQEVHVKGDARPLKVGMQLDADVMLGRRRLVEWLVDPLDTRLSSSAFLADSGGARK